MPCRLRSISSFRAGLRPPSRADCDQTMNLIGRAVQFRAEIQQIKCPPLAALSPSQSCRAGAPANPPSHFGGVPKAVSRCDSVDCPACTHQIGANAQSVRPHYSPSRGPLERQLTGRSLSTSKGPLVAGTVSSQRRREAAPRRTGQAGQGQLSASIRNSHSRPSAVVDRHRMDDRFRLGAALRSCAPESHLLPNADVGVSRCE